MDYDSDDEEETLIYIHDENQLEGDNIYFTVLAYIDGNNIKILHEDSSDNPYDIAYDYVSNVIDIFDDGKYEFINLRSYSDMLGSCNVIYRLKGKKFVQVTECKIVENRG